MIMLSSLFLSSYFIYFFSSLFVSAWVVLTGFELMKFVTFPGTIWLSGSRLLVFTALPKFIFRCMWRKAGRDLSYGNKRPWVLGPEHWVCSKGETVNF